MNYFEEIKINEKTHYLFDNSTLQDLTQRYNNQREEVRVEHIFPNHQGLVTLLRKTPQFFGITPSSLKRVAVEEKYYVNGKLFFSPDITFETPSLGYFVEVKSGSKPFHREKAEEQVARMLEYREGLDNMEKDIRVCLVMPHSISQFPKRFMSIDDVLDQLSLEVYPTKSELRQEKMIHYFERKYICA